MGGQGDKLSAVYFCRDGRQKARSIAAMKLKLAEEEGGFDAQVIVVPCNENRTLHPCAN